MSILDQGGGASAPTPADDRERELITLIGQKFISRKDVKAIERSSGAWNLVTDTGKADGVRQGFTMTDMRDHLAGRKAFGHYLVGTDDTCKFFAFDIDLTKEGSYLDLTSGESLLVGGVACNPREVWQDRGHPGWPYLFDQVRTLADGLARRINRLLGIHVAVTFSGGKGMHVYGFMGAPKPAAVVRELAVGVLTDIDLFVPSRGENFYVHKHGEFQNCTIEVFPKQDSLDGKDLGNLMRLPLGTHGKTGQRGFFVSLKAASDKPVEMDALRVLEGDLPWE